MSRSSCAAPAFVALALAMLGCSGQNSSSTAVLPQTSSPTGLATSWGDPFESPFTATPNWAQANHDAGHTGNNALETILGVSNVANLTLGWTFSTPAQVEDIAESGGRLYVTANNYLYAVNESTGMLIWEFNAGPGSAVAGGTQSNLALSGNRVFVSCSTDNVGHAGVCALNAATGHLEWTWAIYVDGNPVTSYPDNGPTIAGGDVIFAEQDSNGSGEVSYFINLNASTGALNWQIGGCNDDPTNNFCRGDSSYPVAIGKGVFYAGGGGDGKNGFNAGTCAHSVSNGSIIWCHNTNNGFDAVSTAGTTVYTMSSPNNSAEVLTAINATTGNVDWTYTYPSGCCRNTIPAIAGGVVYAETNANGTLDAFKARSGKMLWTVGNVGNSGNYGSPAAVANGVVYNQSSGGGPTAYNAATGAQLWTDTSHQLEAGVAVVNGKLYSLCNYNNVCQYVLPPSRARHSQRSSS